MSLKLIRKISTRTVLGKLKLADGESKRFLYQVVGIARGFKNGESNFGPYTEFTGDFAAIIPTADGKLTGAGFRAPRAFFPEPFSGMLESSLKEMVEANATAKQAATDAKTAFIPNPVSAEFKCNVWAVADEKSTTGYTYQVEPVVKVKESDALKRLMGATGEGETVDAGTGEVETEEEKTGKKGKGKKH